MSEEIVILGGGPAGLTAAYQLSKEGIPSILVEKEGDVGGLARTVHYKQFHLDIGGHRLFTKIPEVRTIWQELLGEELLSRPRLSRIHYRGRFFHYPLRPLEALLGLGMGDTCQVILSYLWARGFPTKAEENFEQWVSNRFGRKLYDIFFKTYTEKVWGIPCTEIAAEWAAQRIQNLSLGSAVRRALFPQRANTTIHTLVDRFEYPRLGPGQLWDRCRDLVCAHGQQVLTGYTVVEIHHAGGRVTGVLVRDREGRHELLPAAQVISSLALADVIRALRPAPPTEVLVAAEQLRYRGFLTVGLVVDRAEMFGDNWLYVHSPEVRVGRIQNYKNWSPDLVQDPEKTCLGLEYFVWEGNDLWASPDEQLIELAIREAAQLGLLAPQEVSDGLVVRMEKAYPVYDDQYKQALATIREYLQGLSNLQQIGRNGQHRYNNQDHSMMTAILAVRNVMGERHDIWAVNIDAKYHETFDRAQPRRLVPAVRSAAQRSAPARRAH